MQGKFLELLAEEEKSYDWKSVMFNLPSRVCKFMINSISDTLNTKANLVRWGKAMTSKCKACGNHETLHHILNNCSKFLEQGRYTWRHNNILAFIHKHLKSSLNEHQKLSCDLEGLKSGFTTIPLDYTVTDLIPDLCIFSEIADEKSLFVLELSVPFELNITKAHAYKMDKYSSLINDIELNNISTSYIALEIGSRGYIDQDNMKRLKDIYSFIDSDHISFKDFKNSISKIAVLSSFVIYCARNDPHWDITQTLYL